MLRAMAVAVTMAVAGAAQADLLVDNYLSEDDYDHRTALSAERNTIIAHAWTVDDGAFEVTVFSLDAQHGPHVEKAVRDALASSGPVKPKLPEFKLP